MPVQARIVAPLAPLGKFTAHEQELLARVRIHVAEQQEHERHRSFYNANTGETLQVVYRERRGYIRGALAEIDYLLRDHHTDRVRPIDLRLLDLLHDLSAVLETVVPLQVLSAYRSRATNLRLRARGRRAARHSWHLRGTIDIRIPGRSLAAVRRAALALKGGGVGYYPRHDFVHMDVGPVHQWK